MGFVLEKHLKDYGNPEDPEGVTLGITDTCFTCSL
jgi:hypothetical protein